MQEKHGGGGVGGLNVARNALPEEANEVTVYDPLSLCHRLNGNKMPVHTKNHSNTLIRYIEECTHTHTLSLLLSLSQALKCASVYQMWSKYVFL